MSEMRDLKHVREAVGVFDTAKDLETAIDELEESGFDRADISLLGSDQSIEQKLGHIYWKVQELEDDASAPRTAYIERESLGDAQGALIGLPLYIAAGTAAGMVTAVGGPLSVLIAATAIAGGGGALLGGILAHLLSKTYAEKIESQLEHGGLLLWVRTWSNAQESKAQQILAKNNARDIHIHQLKSEAVPETLPRCTAFAAPEGVVTAQNLNRDQKIRILLNWEYDARELAVASEEGMPDAWPDLLQRVLTALYVVEGAQPTDRNAPEQAGGRVTTK